MKILKMFRIFFKNIIKFIDVKVVTPITKLIIKLTSRFENSGRDIEAWLTRKNTLLFISMFLAITTFIVIDQKILVFTENNAEVLKNQEVNVIYNSEAYVVEGLPETVDVALIGSQTDLYIAKQSSTHEITVDLTGLGVGTHKVNIEYTQNTGSIEYMVNPSEATVIIYPKVSETRTLAIDLLNTDELDSKLVIASVNYDTDKVVIKGSEKQLEKVAEVKALVDINQIVEQTTGTTTIEKVLLKAYDVDGNVVDVEIVPETIDVSLEITSPSKELPIQVVPEGEVAFGLAIENLILSETNVIVYGDSEIIDELLSFPVYIDVDGLEKDKEYKIELEKPLGVTSLSTNTLTLDLTLGEQSSKDIEDVRIQAINLNDNYSVQGVDESGTSVIVNVKGVSSIINNLTSDDINAYIDLEGLEVGTHKVDVQVEGDDPRVTYESKTIKATVEITEK